MQKRTKIIIGAIVAFVVIGAIGSGGDEESTVEAAEATTTTEAPTTTTRAPTTTTTLTPEDKYLREARSRFTGEDEGLLALGNLGCTILSLSDGEGDFEGAALIAFTLAEVETGLPPEVIGETALMASQHLCPEYEDVSGDIVDLLSRSRFR